MSITKKIKREIRAFWKVPTVISRSGTRYDEAPTAGWLRQIVVDLDTAGIPDGTAIRFDHAESYKVTGIRIVEDEHIADEVVPVPDAGSA